MTAALAEVVVLAPGGLFVSGVQHARGRIVTVAQADATWLAGIGLVQVLRVSVPVSEPVAGADGVA